MNINEFKNILEAHTDKKIHLVLPDEKSIPSHFHVTEVGHVQKNFIDCGGTERSVSSCVLQAWVAVNDEDHSLAAGKLAKILTLAAKILGGEELPVEVEFEAPYISQFPIASADISDDAITFRLTTKNTDCLAKEKCGLESAPSCCSADDDCCD